MVAAYCSVRRRLRRGLRLWARHSTGVLLIAGPVIGVPRGGVEDSTLGREFAVIQGIVALIRRLDGQYTGSAPEPSTMSVARSMSYIGQTVSVS